MIDFRILFSNLKRLILLSVFVASILPSHLYAQDDDDSTSNNKTKRKTVTSELIRVNKSVSKEVNKAADIIDKSISPKSVDGNIEENKTQLYFIVGGDFADNGKVKGNFRYGAQLHLPRFEKYWKVKFANQDEKRDRGQSSMTREQRTRNAREDIFVGVNFARSLNRINFEYQPQIAYHNGLGLDHSLEVSTEYEAGRFDFKPSLELFANHDEGVGSSSAIKFVYWFFSKSVALEQGNDGRFVSLDSAFSVNHTLGISYSPTDRLKLATRYFRSFANDMGYRLAAYGAYIDSNYEIYKNALYVQFRPYIVYEREEDFEEIKGVVLNFKVSF